MFSSLHLFHQLHSTIKKINTCKLTVTHIKTLLSVHSAWHFNDLTPPSAALAKVSNPLAWSREPMAMSLRQSWVNQWSRTDRERHRAREKWREWETIIYWEAEQKTAGPRHTWVRTNNSSPKMSQDPQVTHFSSLVDQWYPNCTPKWSASHP